MICCTDSSFSPFLLPAVLFSVPNILRTPTLIKTYRHDEHMGNSTSEHIQELINMVHKVGLTKCSFEYYMNGETKPLESKENRAVGNVPALIEEIRKEHVSTFDIKDTGKMSPIEVKRAYDQCAHWAQNPKKHEYGTSRMIYDVFVGGEAGGQFGKKRPAMIVYDSSSGDILFVLPHDVTKERFDLRRRVSFHTEETVSIHDFLRDLKQDLDSTRFIENSGRKNKDINDSD